MHGSFSQDGIIVILLVIVVGIFLFFRPHSKREIDVGLLKDGIQWKMANEPSPSVPDHEPPKPSAPESKAAQKMREEDKLENIALNKPVVYVGRQILLEGTNLGAEMVTMSVTASTRALIRAT